MKFKTYTGITWSDLELSGLLEDEDSRVHYTKFKKHLALHPFHLTNPNTAINEILSSTLNSYDAELKGFVLVYKNPKLLTPLGGTFYDTCFIHIDVEADFYVFKPEVGFSLKGIVNKKGLDHIGVLVHKTFNVSIPNPDDEEDWPGDNLEIGQEVRLLVTYHDFSCKLPFIRGVLNRDDYLEGCRLLETTVDTNNMKPSDSDNWNTVESTGNGVPVANNVHTKQDTYFSTDSKCTSDEDKVQIKKEISRQKKSKKKLQQDESFEHNEEQKDRKRVKKLKEVKPELDTIETIQNESGYNISMNGDANNVLEDSIISKKHSRKKHKNHSPPNSASKDNNEISEIYTTDKISKKLFATKSKDEVSRISIKSYVTSSGSELTVEEDALPKDKAKSKKKSVKKTYLNDVDNSSDDFSTDKYITSRSKKNSQEVSILDIENEEALVNIKSERIKDTSDGNSEVETSYKKKSHSKHKRQRTNSESTNAEETDHVKPSKKLKKNRELNESTTKFNMQTIKIEPGFTDVVIKQEGYDDDCEGNNIDLGNNTNDISETYLPKRKYRIKLDDLSNEETDLENNAKHLKKSKAMNKATHAIKVEMEKSMTSEEDVENIYSEVDTNDTLQTYSTKKKRKINSDDGINNGETDLENNSKHWRKSTKTHTVKVKSEKSIMDDEQDDNVEFMESITNQNSSVRIKMDTDEQYNEKSVKHSKDSPSKQLNKSKKSELEFSYRKIKLKVEELDS